MSKNSINSIVKSMLILQEEKYGAALLGIGPMSKYCVQAALELSNDENFPIMFIASRNQVDDEKFGGGYVNGWSQHTFSKAVKEVAEKIGYNNEYFLCRDHGGPWQRDEERKQNINEEEAMKLGKESYLADIKAGFELLMIDPTKDPIEVGKVIPLDVVINRTVDLIEYCEKERKKLKIKEIGYEVGTEETNGGLTDTETYEKFIIKLKEELESKNLPLPTFIVGQTGTLTRKTEQVGNFNFKNAKSLADMASKYKVGLKEHNGDYLSDNTLLEHIPSKVTAINIAPQYGTEETRAYLNLAQVEKKIFENQKDFKLSNITEVLLEKAIKSGRWRKWMVGKEKDLEISEIFENKKLSGEILDIAGHYTFNDQEVDSEIQKMFDNLNQFGINAERYVIDHIKRPIRDYVECLNLKDLSKKIEEISK